MSDLPPDLAARVEAMLDKMIAARQAIDAHAGAWGKPGRKAKKVGGNAPPAEGTIDCPACGGMKCLRYYRSGRSGATRVACQTPGCVRWDE